MGLTDKIFNKKEEEKKPSREVGSNFDKSDAEKIFDALDRVEAKEKREIPENIKKEISKTKDIAGLLEKAQGLMMSEKFTESIEIFKQVLAIDSSNAVAYESLADIYSLQNDKNKEIDILKTAIQNVNSSKAKADLMNRLKELK